MIAVAKVTIVLGWVAVGLALEQGERFVAVLGFVMLIMLSVASSSVRRSIRLRQMPSLSPRGRHGGEGGP